MRILGPSVMVVAFLIGCHGVSTSGRDAETKGATPVSPGAQGNDAKKRVGADSDLLGLAKDFATSDKGKRDDAWKSLSTLSRVDLVSTLVRLRDNGTAVDSDRIAVAFLLCNLDSDYEANKSLIVAAVTKEPHHENILADWEAELIGRLISRGDRDLLTVLFKVSEWSDGALSASLSTIFEEQLTSDSAAFLSQLTLVSKNTRRKVYERFDEDTLTLDEIARVRAYLTSIQSEPKSMRSLVARELATKLSQVKSRLRKNDSL